VIAHPTVSPDQIAAIHCAIEGLCCVGREAVRA
jgi:hypothetical protein